LSEEKDLVMLTLEHVQKLLKACAWLCCFY